MDPCPDPNYFAIPGLKVEEILCSCDVCVTCVCDRFFYEGEFGTVDVGREG